MDTTKKIIRGVVNSRGFTITSPITQWDYGWQFVPEIEDLPATYRLDFSNEEKQGTALPVYCGSEGAEIPTELIDTGKDILVWFVRIGEGYGITEYKWRIPNKCKPKTEQDEPTPSQQSSIDQAISVINDAVDEAKDAQKAIEDMSVSAQTLAEGESATVTKTESEGVVHLEFGIPRGEKGLKGDPGRQGDTGESPVILRLSKDVVYVPMDREYRTKIAIADDIFYEYRRGDEQIDGIMDFTGTLNGTNITCTNVRACTPTQRGLMTFTIPQGVTLLTNADTQLVVGFRFVFDYTDLDGNRRIIARSILFVGVMDGAQGESALDFSISNPSAVIHADKDGYTTRQTVIKPIISVFKGETELTYAVSNISNIGVKDRNGNISSIPATVVSGMNPKWTIPADRMFFPESGELSITVTADGQSKVLTYGYAVVKDGEQGEPGAKGNPGEDGVSPTVSITPITGGHRITITDADGEHSADVMDGTGNVDDVQINGSSIVSDGVANVPIASADELGAVKINASSGGIGINNSSGVLRVYAAGNNTIKSGSNGYLPIVPQYQHIAAFYGLAKASGDSTQSSSSNAVGVYTEEAKSKIREMLGADGVYELVADEVLQTDVDNNNWWEILLPRRTKHLFIFANILESAMGTSTLCVRLCDDIGATAYSLDMYSSGITTSAKKHLLEYAFMSGSGLIMRQYNNDNSGSQLRRQLIEKKEDANEWFGSVKLRPYNSSANLPAGSRIRVFIK